MRSWIFLFNITSKTTSSYANMKMHLNGYVYVGCPNGHRESYTEFFSHETGLEALIEPRSLATAVKLLRAKYLLFSTMENDRWFFLFIAVARSFMSRDTSAIVMNVDVCFRGGGAKRFLAKLAYGLPTFMGNIHMISILPFYLNEKYRRLSNDWIYDPQFWDIKEQIEYEKLPITEISEQIKKRSEGKPILLYLGKPSEHKGFDFLLKILRAESSLASDFFIVVSGKAEDAQRKIEDIKALGIFVVDRYLTDDEVLSLKKVSTCLWAVYHPKYNSSSGVFGRAMQLSKYVCVRRGSILDQIAKNLNYPVNQCEFDNVKDATKMLKNVAQNIGQSRQVFPADIAARCREASILPVLNSLNLKLKAVVSGA